MVIKEHDVFIQNKTVAGFTELLNEYWMLFSKQHCAMRIDNANKILIFASWPWRLEVSIATNIY